jgi:DEAD/DEAH box helicase domain-containing protein
MNTIYFDLETQKLFEEVGERDASKLGLACAVTWSTAQNDFNVYWEKDVAALIDELKSADRVIGFNIFNFDFEVLRPYAPNENFEAIRATDMLQDVYRALNFRVSLDSIARGTLGISKNADGAKSVEWFRTGNLDKVVAYCKIDVDITRHIYEFGHGRGYIQYFSKLGIRMKVPVDWT